MLTTRRHRNMVAAVLITLIPSVLAIAPANAAVRKDPGVSEQSLITECGPLGNLRIPAIRITPAGTIRIPASVGVPLNTEPNDRIG